MLRRLGIRAKVMAVLAVPMLVIFGAGAYISYDALTQLRYANAAQSVVETLQAYAPLATALETERTLSLAGGTPAQIGEARTATDAALAAVKPVTAALDLAEFPDAVVEQFQAVQTAHNQQLPAARTIVDKNGQRAVVQRYYADIIGGQIALMEQVSNSLKDRTLAAYITAYREIADTSDNLVAELVDGVSVLSTGGANTSVVRAYGSQAAATELARTRARVAVDSLAVNGLALPAKDPTSNFTRMRSIIAEGDATKFGQVDPTVWVQEIQAQATNLSDVNTNVLAAADDVAQQAVTDARSQALLTIALAILAAIVSLFFALLVARGIIVPLRRLTVAAGAVREQLPRLVEQVAIPGEGPEITLPPIPVDSKDEVGQLAQAFNAVNQTTVQVAQEQAALRGSIAEMFVNVARRDQVLLNRQLSFIDSLERAEEDPSTLANLFRLDHLATRMRRNAESLLVLAGIDTGRRLRDAMPLSDVVRTASSEIEQYDRIELDLQVDPHMHGFNALGAAHMLAELLENATIFSEPETPVTVTTGVSGQYVVVRVLDHGLGMSDAELEAANSKIVSTSASDSLGNQRLGLFVVGRIAQRLGADVRLLKAAHGTGTETIVRFPATLFVATETALYGGGAPAALAAPRVDPGLPEIEAPLVQEVDLAALTDGQTPLGLPKRRSRDDDATVDEGPIPLTELPSAGTLPSRSKKTFDEDNLVLPEAPDGHIAPEISAAALGSDWKPPTAAPAGGGLPSRSRASTPAWATPEEPTTSDSLAAPAPAARAGLFSGFRGRTPAQVAEEAAANGETVPTLGDEDGERAQPPAQSNAVHAPWMSAGAHAAPVEPMVIPQLADDEDDSWEAQEAEHREAASMEAAAEIVLAEQLTQGDDLAAFEPDPSWAPPTAEDAPVWEPTPAWETPAAEAETPAWEPPAAWAAPVVEDAAPVWEPTPAAEADAPVWEPTPAAEADAPVWEPTPAAEVESPVDETDEVADVPQASAVEEPVWEPTPAWSAPVAEAVEAPVWEPTPAWEAPEAAVEEPVWTPTPAWDLPQAVAETDMPAETPAWEAPDVDTDAWSLAVAEEPVWEPVVATDSSPLVQVDEVAPVEAPVESEPAAEIAVASALPSRLAPAAEVVEPVAEAPVWEAPVWEAPVATEAAPTAPTQSFSSYSGYAGWSAPATDADVLPFERTLDEARAWHTGSMPVVPEPEPAAVDSAWPTPAWSAPEAETVVEPEPVAVVEPEPEVVEPVWAVAEEPVAEEPVAEVVEPVWAVAEEPVAEVVEPVWAVAEEPVAEAQPTPAWAAPDQDAPAWPSLVEAPADELAAFASVESPTQLFTPIEAASAVTPDEQLVPDTFEPTSYAPTYEQPYAPSFDQQSSELATRASTEAPAEAPAWAPEAVAAVAAPLAEATFGELVAPAPVEDTGRRRWGLFGRKKNTEPAAVAAVGTVAPAPVSFEPPANQPTPVRTSAWTADAPAPAPQPEAASWMASTTWSAPAPVQTAPELAPEAAPAPIAAEHPSAGSWSPPDWNTRPNPAPRSTVPQPALPPSVAPRVGTLDDDVAAMLALRSDIQEQALSELSQLSAYRPSASGGSAERLTKRVAQAVPASTIAEDEGKPVQRDADQLRSRLSSFQSGTSRGRQASEDPSSQNGAS